MVERLVFVCTGNTCRSPMAEGMFRALAAQEGLTCQVRSAGVSAAAGAPISAHSAAILRDKGLSDRLYADQVTAQTIAWADLVLTMTTGHKQTLIRLFPEAADKVYTLKQYVNEDEAVTNEQQQQLAELQIKLALGQPVTEEEWRLLDQYGRDAAGMDISDPFGGDHATYAYCAQEIETCLLKLIAKLQRPSAST